MIPNRMENLNQTEATTTSAKITWKVPFNLQLFPPGLEFKIAYHIQSSWVDTTVFHVRILAMFLFLFFYFLLLFGKLQGQNGFLWKWKKKSNMECLNLLKILLNYVDCSRNRIVDLVEQDDKVRSSFSAAILQYPL